MRQAVNKKTKTVLAFGTFDLLHAGHRFFLRHAKRLGQTLTVVVTRNKNVLRLKGKLPEQGERTRLRAVRRLHFVTHAMLGQNQFNHRYDLVRKLKPDVIVLGYDQRTRTRSLKCDLHKLGLWPKLIRLKPFRPQVYKSSKLRHHTDTLA